MLYLFLADGFEETEALATLDFLRRAGLMVASVGISNKTVTGSHNITVVADYCDSVVLPDNNCDGIVLPGGMPGTVNLEKSPVVKKFINYAFENNLLIAAICAAPSILGHMGILNNRKAVCYDGFETQLDGAEVLNERVCRDNNIITAVGAGASLEFAQKIAEFFVGTEKAEKIKESMKCIL